MCCLCLFFIHFHERREDAFVAECDDEADGVFSLLSFLSLSRSSLLRRPLL